MAIEMFAGNTNTGVRALDFEVRDAIWYLPGLGIWGYQHQPRDTVFRSIATTTSLWTIVYM